MREALRVSVRYDTRRDFGGNKPETRREYNTRFQQEPGPEADVPLIAGHVWEWYWRLAARRVSTENGPQPLSFAEIKAWMELSGTEVREREIEMLLALDDAYIGAEQTERVDQAARQKGSAPRTKAGRLF